MAFRIIEKCVMAAVLTCALAGPALPQGAAPKKHTEIGMALKDKQAFVGRYALDSGSTMTIRLFGPQLQAEVTGQAAAYIYPEGPTNFFYKGGVETTILFTLGKDGKASSLTLLSKGRKMNGKRVGA